MASTIVTDIFGCSIKKKSINGKRKGNTNELAACKSLGFWVNQPFKRVPGSGSLRWDDASKIAGDLTCDNKDYFFRFSVETKALASIPIKPRLDKRSKIFKIMEQAMFDAIRSERLPMLMLRPNDMPTFTVGRKKYQDYYIVMLYRFGGRQLAYRLNETVYKLQPEFIGKCDRTGFDLVGYKLSDLIFRGIDFETFNSDLAHAFSDFGDIIETFLALQSKYYKWSH